MKPISPRKSCRVIPSAALLLAAFAFVTSCSRHDDHDHSGHSHSHADHKHDHAGHDHKHHDHAHAKHDHSAHAGHDHAHHDHAGHSHDHAKHSHAHAKHEHDHSAHDHKHHDHASHAHHDHSAHDHGHKSEPAKKRDPHAGHSHGHSHGTESTTVTYDEKTGLTFEPDTEKAIKLATAPIATRPFEHRIVLNATVIDAGTPVRASALVAPAVAADMESHAHDGVSLISVSRALTHATGQVEVTFALAENAVPSVSDIQPPQLGTPAIGDSLAVTITGPVGQKLTIPNSAVLRTIEGTFAYIHHGGHYKRTPITIGRTDGDYSELLSGLSPGDVVAITPVEQLWLTELRLTKGGGHSH